MVQCQTRSATRAFVPAARADRIARNGGNAMAGRWVALAVLTAARVSMAFQFQSLASVAPVLVRENGLGFASVGVLVVLYMLPGVVLAVPGGWLGERFGDKRVVTLGLGLMVLGDLVAGFVPGYGALLAGWQAALHVTAAAALAALLLMALAYRPHPNDRKPRGGVTGARRISLREV